MQVFIYVPVTLLFRYFSYPERPKGGGHYGVDASINLVISAYV